MINFYGSMHKSIKAWFDSIRFYGNYADRRTPKALLTALVLNDFIEWTKAEYLGEDDSMYAEVLAVAKQMLNNLMLTNCAFKVEKAVLGDPAYTSVNDGSSRIEWLRIIDAPDHRSLDESEFLGSGFTEIDKSCVMNFVEPDPEPVCDPQVIFFPTEIIKITPEGYPDVDLTDPCVRMNLYINEATGEAYRFDGEKWIFVNAPISQDPIGVELIDPSHEPGDATVEIVKVDGARINAVTGDDDLEGVL